MKTIKSSGHKLRQIGTRIPDWFSVKLERLAQEKDRSFNLEVYIRLQESVFLDWILAAPHDGEALSRLNKLKKRLSELVPGDDLFTGLKPNNAKEFNALDLGCRVDPVGDDWEVTSKSVRITAPSEMEAVRMAFLQIEFDRLACRRVHTSNG